MFMTNRRILTLEVCPTSFLADPGKARGCSMHTIVTYKQIWSVTLFLPWLYGVAKPKQCYMLLQVIKQTMLYRHRAF